MSSPNQLSFLPDDFLETKRKRRTNFVCALLFLVIMSGIGVGFTFIEKSLRIAAKEHEEVSKQFADAASRIEQERQMQEKQQKMNAQAELTASLLEKVPRSVLLAELTKARPAGVSFLDLMLDSKVRAASAAAPSGGKTQFELKRAASEGGSNSGGGSTPPPVAKGKAYDVTIRLTGIADTDVQVAQFLARLNQSKLVRDVNLIISDEFAVAEAKMRKFQIDMSVDPNAEVDPDAAQPLNANTAAVEVK
jgi:Tfp pilus assembly protein PilN